FRIVNANAAGSPAYGTMLYTSETNGSADSVPGLLVTTVAAPTAASGGQVPETTAVIVQRGTVVGLGSPVRPAGRSSSMSFGSSAGTFAADWLRAKAVVRFACAPACAVETAVEN